MESFEDELDGAGDGGRRLVATSQLEHRLSQRGDARHEGGSNVVLDDAYGAAYDAAGEYTGDLIVEEAGSSRAFLIL